MKHLTTGLAVAFAALAAMAEDGAKLALTVSSEVSKSAKPWVEMTPDELVSGVVFGGPVASGRYRLDLEKRMKEQGRDAAAGKFLPFVDRYGQFKHLDWPGKVKDDADLKRAAAEEEKRLKAEPEATAFSTFGGWKDGPRLKATGRFRMEKVDGKWWFVDPEGYLFWSHGVVRVSPTGGLTPLAVAGDPSRPRDAFFEELPAADSPYAAFYQTTDAMLAPFYEKWGVTRTFDFTGANLMRLYGKDWFAKWTDRVHRRLRAWGVNTVANGSHPSFYAGGRTPYAPRVEALWKKDIAGADDGFWWRFPDPWSDTFTECLDRAFATWKQQADDPWCLGFFVDNELNFGDGDETLLARWTLRSPDHQPVKRAFADWMEKKYGAWAKASAAWGTDFKDRAAFLACTDAMAKTDAAKADLEAFSGAISEKYFSGVRAAVKKANPKALYLGCRWAGGAPAHAVAACARHADVTSFNCYADKPASLAKLAARYDTPLLIDEFHFMAPDRGLPALYGHGVKDQAARVRSYRTYAEFSMRDPNVVGVHWHQYSDQPFTGRFDGEAANVGLVDIADRPFPELTAELTACAANMYMLRGGDAGAKGRRVAALPDAAWAGSAWLSVPGAPVATEAQKKAEVAADGSSWFVSALENAQDVKKAVWMTAGLGVYELYVNGVRVGGADALKPGYTSVFRTRRAFSYDVTEAFACAKGARNTLAAEVSAGWWRDKIVGYAGTNSAFRGVLEVTYADGSAKRFGTNPDEWTCAVAGPVKHAAIFDGETYDAREPLPFAGGKGFVRPEVNTEFKGEILPTDGAEIVRRWDLALDPTEAYCWKGATGAGKDAKGNPVLGTVTKTRTYDPRDRFELDPGETLVVDFGQNCAGVPVFEMRAAEGVTLTCLPGEMLNDGNGERSRGNDGPAGSVYRENLRSGMDAAGGMTLRYTFGKGSAWTVYFPRHTFFGYRYLSLAATGKVTFRRVWSVPVTSVTKEMEIGTIAVGHRDLNRFLRNVRWGQLSNYLSVPTDCPQRNERLGWTADTQVFAEAGSFLADTRAFFRKWMRDMRDSRDAEGGFPSVAPYAQYGNETFNLGWADAGVIVPWTVWRQFGDRTIVEENWEAMAKFVRRIDEKKYKYDDRHYTYADWLSYETFETCGNSFGSWSKWARHPDARNYREYLAACYWLYDARLMAQMAGALGKSDDAAFFRAAEKRALDYVRATYLEKDGLLLRPMRHLQTASIFALKFGITEGAAREATKELLLTSIREHGDCLQTGFLGTGFLMDTLTEIGRTDVAYTLLLQRKNPSWLYSVDQGATTVWERWNSYTKESGFGPIDMNSFNHYAYGAVAAWIWKHAAGIAADPSVPGFGRLVMAPKPDRRLDSLKAEYRSAAGVIRTNWRYRDGKWLWDFTVPPGATALVTAPGDKEPKEYGPGDWRIVN